MLKDAVKAAEKSLIEKTIKENRGALSQSARALGISRMTLYRLIAKHGIVTARPSFAKVQAAALDMLEVLKDYDPADPAWHDRRLEVIKKAEGAE